MLIRAAEIFSSLLWRVWRPDTLKGAAEETAREGCREGQRQQAAKAQDYAHPFHSLHYKWV